MAFIFFYQILSPVLWDIFVLGHFWRFEIYNLSHSGDLD